MTHHGLSATPPKDSEGIVCCHSILVVDDSKSIRVFLHGQLTAANHCVFTAVDGLDALNLVQSHHFDIILCDMQMPHMDGPAFRRKLLSHPRYAAIPFVAMSTNDTTDNFQAMRELKAAAFLTKPFKPDQLFILIDRLLADTALLERTKQDLAKVEKQMLLNSIMSLAQALDARDGYTRSHSESVALMAVRIGEAMELDPHTLEQLEIAGRLHDIGKIGIQDCVLQKPGELTPEEFEIIKTHPAVGARILGPIPSLSDVAEVIHSHHERFDGNGYPRGLRGLDIHLMARILSIADVYDALTSDRPYRKGFSPQRAVSIMHRGRGVQFCPACLDAFLVAVGYDAFKLANFCAPKETHGHSAPSRHLSDTIGAADSADNSHTQQPKQHTDSVGGQAKESNFSKHGGNKT